jgi:hypothetical protein
LIVRCRNGVNRPQKYLAILIINQVSKSGDFLFIFNFYSNKLMGIKDCCPKCSKPFGLSQAKFCPLFGCLQEFERLLEPKQSITKYE